MFWLKLITIITASLLLITKKTQITILLPSTLKVNAPSDIKKTIINNLISRAKLISPSNQYFIKNQKIWNKLSSIMGSLTILLMNKLNA